MSALTAAQMATLMPACREREAWARALDAAARAFQIDSRLRLAAWIANIAHETSELTRLSENLNYSAEGLVKTWPSRFTLDPKLRTKAYAPHFARQADAIANMVYAGRMGNGPAASGDGWLYRGRGPAQLTGREAYAAAAIALGVPAILADPDCVAEDRMIGARVAAWFYVTRGCAKAADAGDIDTVCRKWNGGEIGLDDRRRRYARALKVLP